MTTPTEQHAALPEVARARIAWRLAHPSPDEIALYALNALAPGVGAAEDLSIPDTWGAVLAVAQRKRDRLEAAYLGLIE
jgi:hypothetical protein